MPPLSSELLRIDPLTECQNFLGFLEACLNVSVSDSPTDTSIAAAETTVVINRSRYSAILFVDLRGLSTLNAAKGHAYGDSVIHWMGILLSEESTGTVFRLGGDEFAVLLKMDTREEHSTYLERILARIDREARLLDFPEAPASLALILCDQPLTLDALLLLMAEAMLRVRGEGQTHAMVFNASDFGIASVVSPGWKSRWEPSGSGVPSTVRWLSYKMIHQILDMGRSLDKAQQDAYTDAISNLPNMKAALLNLEHTLQDAAANRKIFSFMMIDGDNIRAYNSINYAAGDVMIRDLSAVFKSNLRPSDFVARWRTGDEFIVILPDTPIGGAKAIGGRFRLAVKEASKAWRFPVTISIGIACYPTHGDTVNTLIDMAESANKRAKEQGKDQVVLAE